MGPTGRLLDLWADQVHSIVEGVGELSAYADAKYGEDECPLADLMTREPYCSDEDRLDVFAGVLWPEWQERSCWQRDFYAEAMGY